MREKGASAIKPVLGMGSHSAVRQQSFQGSGVARSDGRNPTAGAMTWAHSMSSAISKLQSKAMYDARERAIRDRKSEINAAIRKGKIEGKIETIQLLQGILRLPITE